MDLYAEIILDHFKNPHHFGLLNPADLLGQDSNPMCGDKLKISLRIDGGKVTDVGFEGEGCAISVAAMSILSDEIIGKTLDEVENFSNDDLYELLGVDISPGRVKCALLGLGCLKQMINESKK